jgi:Ca2+-binding RTX toxin-like protein
MTPPPPAAEIGLAPHGGGTAGTSAMKSAAGAEHVGVKVSNNTLFVTGTQGDDSISMELLKFLPGILVVDVKDGATGPGALLNKRPVPRILFNKIVVEARGGNDSVRIDESNGVFTDTEQTTMDGGAGADTLTGGSGREAFLGQSEADVVDGNGGDDTALLGGGDDIFRWDPGDGNDTVEGQAGFDTMQFNGSTADEKMEASADGPRLRFTRDVGNIVMDTDDVEHVLVRPAAGTDIVTVNDLSGTDVTLVQPNLAAAIGGIASDMQRDRVFVRGTSGSDDVEVQLQTQGVFRDVGVTGLAASVRIRSADANSAATDTLAVETLAGNDSITATTLPAGLIGLVVDSGAGDDTIDGSQGDDIMLGQADNDTAFGDNGNDVAFLGGGDDTFRWDPGDGSDTIEGQDGRDEMVFNGSGASENVDLSANGGRLRFFRDVATVTMDTDDVERVLFQALGGADNVVVNDLSGTDVVDVDVDLAATIGGTAGDAQADTITQVGTSGDDVAVIVGDSTGTDVFGFAAHVRITHAEVADDVVRVDLLGGDDVGEASSLSATAIMLAASGGADNDVLIGSPGDDVLDGGEGDDVILGGLGADEIACGPGDDFAPPEGNDTIAPDCE